MRVRNSSREKRLWPFFILTILFTSPAYALVAMASLGMLFSQAQRYAFVPLATLAPFAAAALLVHKDGGRLGLKTFLSRAIDLRRISRRRWYAISALLPTVLMLLSSLLAHFAGQPLLPATFSWIAAPLVFLGLFGGALSEELGWMAYAYERMQESRSTLVSVLGLGAAISMWHLPLYAFLIDDPALLIAQALFPLALRIWVVWIYENTAQSIFAATVFHTLFNVCYADLPLNLAVVTELCLAFGLALFCARIPASASKL